MYPFGDFPANLAAFCALLRREYGFHIGAGELIDAMRAIEIVDVSDERAVRAALRTVLTGTREDVGIFDAAFDRFFLSRPGVEERQASELERDDEPHATDAGHEAAREPRASAAESLEMSDGGTGSASPSALDDAGSEGDAVARASYSPLAVGDSAPPEIVDVTDEWIAAARVLIRRVRLMRSRRWRPAPKGRRFDLRRTLRTSLQTGGEPIAARWLARPRSQPRFIVLIDGSRSMGRHAATALTM